MLVGGQHCGVGGRGSWVQRLLNYHGQHTVKRLKEPAYISLVLFEVVTLSYKLYLIVVCVYDICMMYG